MCKTIYLHFSLNSKLVYEMTKSRSGTRTPGVSRNSGKSENSGKSGESGRSGKSGRSGRSGKPSSTGNTAKKRKQRENARLKNLAVAVTPPVSLSPSTPCSRLGKIMISKPGKSQCKKLHILHFV